VACLDCIERTNWDPGTIQYIPTTILIGQQNSEHFRAIADVDRFYHLGLRGNRIGAGSSDPRDRGLSEFGGPSWSA
jgi:microsomal dipeptidase-like Zn-dependent dipeptidase